MRTATTRSLMALFFGAALSLGIAGCPGGGGVPGLGGGKSSVDPDACGNYVDVGEAGRKLKAFLEATASLEKTVAGLEVEVRTGCDAMAKELGVDAKGETREVCDRVIAQLKEDLSVGISAEAKLAVEYKPAVCEVNVDAAVSATASCEAKAEADVAVECSGTCTGTCNGACSGTCEGSAGSGGSGGDCAGQCNGTCQGSCSGGCEGHADVDASAECEAKGEVYAAAEMKCTEPELNVEADASVVVDKPRYDRAIAAIKAGMPRILTVQAKIKPLQGAVTTWVASARGVVDGGKDLAGQFKDQAMCITGQIAAVGQAMTKIEASFSVSVEVSVEASGAAQVGG